MSVQGKVRISSEAKPNSWLAFASDESKVVGCGDTYMEAVEDAERHGEFDPIIVRIPESWEPRVFSHCA